MRVDRTGAYSVLRNDALDDGKVAVAVKRSLPGEQLVQHHAGGEQVRTGVNGLALHLLGRHIFERSHHRALRAGNVARILDTCHPKVGEFDAPAGLHQQVGRLDVAVHDLCGVGIVQRRQQVAHHGQRLLQRVALALVQVVFEVFTLNKLHHQIRDIAVTVGVVDAHDVGVLQARSRTRLGAKTRLVFDGGFFRQVFHPDRLDGDAAVQIGIATFVDQPHGTFAEHADQFVATKLLLGHGCAGSLGLKS